MAGTLSSTGVFKQHIAGSDNNNTNQGFTRYDTTYTNENYALSWTVGDLISNALSWNSSVRMGGLSLSRDFSIRPDIITYPLPTFAGKAAVPTAVDLFINGYRSSNHQLQPGPLPSPIFPILMVRVKRCWLPPMPLAGKSPPPYHFMSPALCSNRVSLMVLFCRCTTPRLWH